MQYRRLTLSLMSLLLLSQQSPENSSQMIVCHRKRMDANKTALTSDTSHTSPSPFLLPCPPRPHVLQSILNTRSYFTSQ